MVYLPVQLLSKNEDVSNWVKSKYQHILVDEFQDVNEMQAQIFPYIIGVDTSFFFVGDDDQCIYEWRGARPKLLKRYANDNRSDTIYLEDNFRSQKGIVSISDLFIAHNSDRIPKRMNAKKHSAITGSEIKAVTSFNRFSSDFFEAAFIADEISRIIEAGKLRYDDIAILLRSNKMQGEAIRNALSNAEIPYSSTLSGDRLYDDFLTVLRTVKDFNKKGNLSKAINFPTRVMDGILYNNLTWARYPL
jgi:DNA helicase-2/ATP-dependent DNA helicase PcrA